MSTKASPVSCRIQDKESLLHPYSEIVNSITNAKFIVDDGDHWLASRDYLSVKIWDLRKPKYFVANLRVQNEVNNEDQLKKAYSNDHIFDKFDLQVPKKSKDHNKGDSAYNFNLLTGGYNNTMHII